MFGWIAISAGVTILIPQLTQGIAIFYDPDYIPKKWHYFMVYQGTNLLVLTYNIFLMKRTPWVHDIGCRLHQSYSILPRLIWNSRDLSCSLSHHLGHLSYQVEHEAGRRICLGYFLQPDWVELRWRCIPYRSCFGQLDLRRT